MSIVERYLMCAEDLAKLMLPEFIRQLDVEVEKRIVEKEAEMQEVVKALLDPKLYPFLCRANLKEYLSKRKR